MDIITWWACGHFSKQKFFSARDRAGFFVDLFHVSFTWLAFHVSFLVDFLLRRFKRRFLVLKYFEVYVSSSCAPFIVFSDHNPLVFLHKLKNKNQRLLRWSLMLQAYNLEIRHIKGKDNLIADCLSRV